MQRMTDPSRRRPGYRSPRVPTSASSPWLLMPTTSRSERPGCSSSLPPQGRASSSSGSSCQRTRSEPRKRDRSAERLVGDSTKLQIEMSTFRDRYFPHQPELKEHFDELGKRVSPDTRDRPQARGPAPGSSRRRRARLADVPEHARARVRDPEIRGGPRPAQPVRAAGEFDRRRKIEHLLGAFPSQTHRHWYSDETFRAVLRLRGIESNAASGYAEAFTARKMILELGDA